MKCKKRLSAKNRGSFYAPKLGGYSSYNFANLCVALTTLRYLKRKSE
nr:MAG TPA: hypothetical protein [Caudoviricetes sp.]